MNAITKMIRRAESTTAIEAELAKLRAAGAAAAADVEEGEAKLATCEVEKDVLAAIARTTAARNRLRAIEAKIDAATTRLALAIAAERQALLNELRGRYGAAVKQFVAQSEKILPLAKAMIELRDRFADNGFGQEQNALPIPPMLGDTVLVERGLLDSFTVAVAAALRLEPTHTAPTAAAEPVQAEVRPEPRRVRVHLRNSPQPVTPVAETIAAAPTALDSTIAGDPVESTAPSRRPALRETPEKGERLFMLHRGRLDHPRKGALQAGDAVSLRLDEGTPLVAKGAGDWITPAELAAIDASLSPNEPRAAQDAPQSGPAAPEPTAEAQAAPAEVAA